MANSINQSTKPRNLINPSISPWQPCETLLCGIYGEIRPGGISFAMITGTREDLPHTHKLTLVDVATALGKDLHLSQLGASSLIGKANSEVPQSRPGAPSAWIFPDPLPLLPPSTKLVHAEVKATSAPPPFWDSSWYFLHPNRRATKSSIWTLFFWQG